MSKKINIPNTNIAVKLNLKIRKDDFLMENKSIGCTVNECKHHCQTENCCTLSRIQVKKHGSTANTVEQTDCGSFEKK